MPRPLEYPPDPARGEMAGWSGRWPGLRRVIARVQWDDGIWTEHECFADQWTRTHVCVVVESDRYVPRRALQLWLPAGQVRANTTPPKPGDLVPAPELGPSYVKHYRPED